MRRVDPAGATAATIAPWASAEIRPGFAGSLRILRARGWRPNSLIMRHRYDRARMLTLLIATVIAVPKWETLAW